MDHEFWRRRWDEGRIGWHRDAVNPAIARHAERLTGGRRSTVLVPLCGKSLDVAWLAGRGHRVVGVELVEQAVRELFAEAAREPTVDAVAGLSRYRAGDITVWCSDFMDVRVEHVDGVDCAYDRASLIALPPAMRRGYVRRLVDLLPSGARVLLVTLAYDQARVEGPPFSVPHAEVDELFADRCDLELLEADEAAEAPGRFHELGVPVVQHSTWMLTVC